MGKKRLDGLTAQEFEHPFDKAALEALKKTPGLDSFLKWLWKNGIEKTKQYLYLSSYIKVTKENLPDIYSIFAETKEILDATENVTLYISSDSDANAYTIGAVNHIIVLNRGLLDICSGPQLQYIIGHEMGHIKARHVLYNDAAGYIVSAAEYLSNKTFGLSGLVSVGLQMSMLHWSRMSEFTADRAGLLACQDFKVAQETDMILAGFPNSNISDLQRSEWIKQTKEFQNMDYGLISKILSYLGGGGVDTQLFKSHPLSVLRSAETIKWIETDGYSDVMSRKTRVSSPTLSKLFCENCGGTLYGNESYCPICGKEHKPSI